MLNFEGRTPRTLQAGSQMTTRAATQTKSTAIPIDKRIALVPPPTLAGQSAFSLHPAKWGSTADYLYCNVPVNVNPPPVEENSPSAGTV
jgi:hypothetical protein